MIRVSTCCLILVLANCTAAQKESWSERFPEIAQRIARLDRRLAAEDAELRKRVLTELTYFRPRDSKVFPPFLRALLKDPSPELRSKAIDLLWEHHIFLGPEELPDSFYVHSVGDFHWKNPVELARVRGLARQLDGPGGGFAIHALGLVGDQEAIALARALLNSKNIFVRHSAALALVQLGQTKEAIEALYHITDAADDETGFYRYRAAEDLVRLGERQAIEVVIDIMESYDFSGHASGPREILEDLTGQFFLTATEAREWLKKNVEPAVAPAVAPDEASPDGSSLIEVPPNPPGK